MNQKDKKVPIFKEDDFLPYVDTSAFFSYIFLSICFLFGSLFYNSQLISYGVVPLAFANMVGCYSTEKYILYVVDITYVFYILLHIKTLI
ncbi:putative transmembrane protein [Vairimorpha necatrix]|uniref:Transmembrane protein n=1 Tax=Vairimorpha necatrix TaxID=6039 RepID=A0AAX4J8H7_9MICR